ncbi:GtrA family protein [Demequina sp. B12]|uniref:GtrA family protein n=1 Tax=Demequina sp. B12 TaxID=2992757 RepID=UPI00237B6531|nr:GtrA family protein [Demequina sp. B12]MDE0572583.1 GtrA family protein [Demequina sp. B12]
MVTALRARMGELLRFGAVGVAGIVVNLGVFNLLRLGPLAPDSEIAGDDDRVVTAKIIATVVSILFAWWAHRGWTFRGPKRHTPTRELVLFGLVNGAALAVEAAVVAVSHHGLGYVSLFADNVASIIGIGLGTITRYIGYDLFVFTSEGKAPDASDTLHSASTDTSVASGDTPVSDADES